MFIRKIYSNFVRKNVFNKESTLLRRTLVTNFKERPLRDVILMTLESTPINSAKDWSNVRKIILEHELNKGQYSIHNIDAMLVGYCVKTNQYDLAESYITFLNSEKIKPNLATVGKYLRLIYLRNYKNCLRNGTTCPESEEQLVVKYYENLRKEYPVLDSFSLENIVLALSLTTRWKECIDLLEEIKISTFPTTTAYSAVIASCFLHDEEDLGWKLLDEMVGYEKIPVSVAYLAYMASIKKLGKKEVLKKLETLFLFLQENDLKCHEDVAQSISELGKKFGLKGSFTTVTYRGICKSCSQKLDSFDLTDEEFNELKRKMLENVIVGRDVFVRTTPEELEMFKQFSGSMERYDVVLDGLNVAYSIGTKQSPHVLSSLVASVVSHFIQQNKKVLVLGRVHMQRWPRRNWDYVTQNAGVFLTQNISQDDPYLLYCALNSGKDTVIVTRDLMRGHKFRLRDARMKILFNRWLSQRQYQLIRVDEKRGPLFRIPPPFNVVAQRNRQTWHVPYETEAPNGKNSFHTTWLCLQT